MVTVVDGLALTSNSSTNDLCGQCYHSYGEKKDM